MVKDYLPSCLAEALALKKEAGEQGLLVAGGTDIMPAKRTAPVMIYLGGIRELQQVGKSRELLSIGAGCSYARLIEDSRIPEVLREAMLGIAAPAVRNAGTLGGNVCHASPAGDTLPLLYAMDGAVVAAHLEGSSIRERRIRIEDFIQGNRQTTLEPEELVLRIEVPVSSYEPMTKARCLKVGARGAQAIAKLSFAGLARVEEDRLIDVRLAFGAVGLTVVRSRELEGRLKGLKLSEAAAAKQEILEAYGRLIRPIDDQRSTAAYRRQVCLNLLEDFLQL